jgi:UDP-N-acetylmuramyl tripeptide synthase
MRIADESRRLTGPNVQTREPGVIAEVEWEPGDVPETAIAVWREELSRLWSALDWPPGEIAPRTHANGAALVFTAPIDLLLAATDVNDWAVASAISRLAGEGPLALEPRRSELAALLATQQNPALVQLRSEARARGVPFLLDDGALTLGHARTSRTWPRAALPRPDEVPWAELRRVPLALITGTNGKTTSARLVARIARCAGLVAGNTSTDGIFVGGVALERGDWTGPAAALRVLRDERVELAVLETARGGILRRGLAVDSCDAALLTNVSADHLGDYGVDDVATMARVKAVVGAVARTVVVNADDPVLLSLAPDFPGRVVLFSLDPARVAGHLAAGGEAWFVRDGVIVQGTGSAAVAVARVSDVPLSFGGAAPYNVSNALGAAALAAALGLNARAITEGLTTFTSSAEDNPGRGNLTEVAGVKVLIDFAHNPAGVRSVVGLARSLAGPGGRLTVCAAMPGDRPDQELREVAGEIAATRPARVIVRELHGYLRGREPGAVPALLRRFLEESGVPPASVGACENETESLRSALESAMAGEVIVVLAHLETDSVRALVSWWKREAPDAATR